MNESKFHDGARSSLRIVAVLTMITVVGIPFGIWLLWRVSSARLTVGPTTVVARALSTMSVRVDEVARFGILRAPILARGIGGALAKRKVGGDEAVSLWFQTKTGKSKKFIVSMYERHDEVIAQVAALLGRQPETLKMGLLFSPTWPKVEGVERQG